MMIKVALHVLPFVWSCSCLIVSLPLNCEDLILIVLLV
jgi:hypothetical protein